MYDPCVSAYAILGVIYTKKLLIVNLKFKCVTDVLVYVFCVDTYLYVFFVCLYACVLYTSKDAVCLCMCAFCVYVIC